LKGFFPRILQHFMKKKNNTLNIRRLVDDLFVPSAKRTSVLYYRLTNFWIWFRLHSAVPEKFSSHMKICLASKLSGQNYAVPAIVCWVDKVLSSQNILAISCKGHWYVLQAFQVDNLEKSGEKNCKSSLHFFISHISYLICLYINISSVVEF
jgi:hypothetical protein